MSERRLAALGWFLLLPLLTPSLANADTTIRVAIVQNAESVALSAPSGLIVKAPNDNVVANGRITVAAGASGLVVDGQRLRSDRIEIRGRNGDITVNNLTVAGRVTIKRQNGKLIAVEIKSSLDRANTYLFQRKVDFYTRHTGRQVDRRVIVAPYADARAQEVAMRLGIEVCTDVNALEAS